MGILTLDEWFAQTKALSSGVKQETTAAAVLQGVEEALKKLADAIERDNQRAVRTCIANLLIGAFETASLLGGGDFEDCLLQRFEDLRREQDRVSRTPHHN